METIKEVLFFSTDTCNKCRQLWPMIENISKQYPDIKLRHITYDTPEWPTMFSEYEVGSVPAVLFTKCTSVIDRYVDIAPISSYQKSFKHLHENNGD